MVKGDHLGASGNQFLGIETWAAARIEYPAPCHRDNGEYGGPVVPGVVRVFNSVILEVLSEFIKTGRPSELDIALIIAV